MCIRDSHQNEYGGTFGGKIIRDKLFAFAGYQRLKSDQNANPLTMFIPTAENLAGNWSITNPITAAEGSTPACGVGGQLCDPLTGAIIPGNIYPSAPAYNAQALALMAYMPTINPAIDTKNEGEVQFRIPSEMYDNQFVIRVDHTINPRNSSYYRYMIDGYQSPSFFAKGGNNGGILLTSQAPGNYERVQTAVASETFTWTSNLVNNFHASGTKRVDLRQSAPGINGVSLGITQYDEVPTNLELEVTGGIAAFNTYCGTCSNGFFNVDDEGAADDLTWIKGQHQLVIGGEFVKVHFNEVAGFQANGNYSFNGEFSGNGPVGGNNVGNGNLDFLWGAMSSFQQSKEQQLALRGPVPSIYIQDTYHMSKRLTLAGGLRWEPEFMPRDQYNRGSTFSMASFLASQVSSIYPNAPAGTFFYGDNGVTKSFTTNPIWNFNPNFGATWDPFGNGSTVIRGGLQVAYDEANFYTGNRNHQNPPFATNVSVSTTGPVCFSEPWLVGGTGYGCDQVGGTNTSPFPQPVVPTPSTAVFPAQGEWIELANPFKVASTLQWTLSVQHEFAKGWQAQVDYIGNKTSNMPVGTVLDPAIYTPGVWGALGTGCGPVQTLSLIHISGFLGVFEGDAKDWSPVEAGDMGMGVLFGDLDAKEAVAGGDVEDTHGASTAIKNQFAERACQGAHHGGHIIGEFNPEGVFGLDRAAAGERSAASANDFGELVVDAFNVGIRQKEGDGGNAGWRGGVEERGARGGVVVVTVLFGEDTADAEEVAEDANAALGGGGVLGDGGYVVMAPADGAEDIELDSGLEDVYKRQSRNSS